MGMSNMKQRTTILVRIFLFAAVVSLLAVYMSVSGDFDYGLDYLTLSFLICTIITLIFLMNVVFRNAYGRGRKLSENKLIKSNIQKKIKSVENEIRSYEEIEKTGTITVEEKNAWRELAHDHLRLTQELSDLP